MKINEFIDFFYSISNELRDEQGCVSLNMYEDIEDENAYIVVCNWDSQNDMDRHFSGRNFLLLKGAARVLGESFTLKVGRTTMTDNVAKEMLNFHR